MDKEIRPKYTLRKLSVGLASVMIGSTILLSSQQVHAADNSAATPKTSTTETTDVKNPDPNRGQSGNSNSTSQGDSSRPEGTDKSRQN